MQLLAYDEMRNVLELQMELYKGKATPSATPARFAFHRTLYHATGRNSLARPAVPVSLSACHYLPSTSPILSLTPEAFDPLNYNYKKKTRPVEMQA
jgi:hypothetical protein